MRRSTIGCGERRKSRASVSGRPSISASSASGKRRSSQYGGARDSHGPGQMKDPRNLSDRGIYRKNIKYLMHFLTEYNYPNPISERILSAPSMKEFKKIFLFIYKFINPVVKDASIDKKPEEEIPKIFKMLGYPFPINKTSMFSVGSPHTWPNLLGALSWLIELTKFSFHVAQDIEGNVMFPDDVSDDLTQESNGYLNRYYFNYLEEAYIAFMRGKELDELDDLQQAFFDKIRSQNASFYDELEAVETENAHLEQELAKLEGPSRLESLVAKQKTLQVDREKFSQYIEDLRRHSKKLKESNDLQEEETIALKRELEAITVENCKLQIIMDEQEISPADVERMKKEKQELIKQLQFWEKERDLIEQQIWNQEIKFAKIHEETSQTIREYNELARKMKIIPANAENARGIDFEIRYNAAQQTNMAAEFKEVVKPALVLLQERISEHNRELQTELVTEEENIDQCADMINEKQEELDALAAKQEAFDKEFEMQKEVMADELQRYTQVVKNQEEKLQETKRHVLDFDEKKKEELREVQARADERVVELNQEVNDWKKFVTDACHVVMAHKTAMSKLVKEVEQKATTGLEETKSLQTQLPEVCQELMNKM